MDMEDGRQNQTFTGFYTQINAIVNNLYNVPSQKFTLAKGKNKRICHLGLTFMGGT